MKARTIILMALVVGVLLYGCTQSYPQSGSATYNPQQGQPGQQPNVVGGGCGVAPNSPYQLDRAAQEAQSSL